MEVFWILWMFIACSNVIYCMGINWSFKKLVDTEISGTMALTKEVSSRIECAFVAETLGAVGYKVPTTIDHGKWNCSVYSSMTDPSDQAGSSAYVAPGYYKSKGAVVHNGKLILSYIPDSSSTRFWEAEAWCKSYGATFFIPKNIEDWTLISQLAYINGFFTTWIPMTDMEEEGTLVWTDGSDISESTFVNWKNNQVGYFNYPDYDCGKLVISEEGNWTEIYPCGYHCNGFICEIVQ